MIKSISFIVFTQFFHFNELKILRQPGLFLLIFISTYFFKLNQQYFYGVYMCVCVCVYSLNITEYSIKHNLNV